MRWKWLGKYVATYRDILKSETGTETYLECKKPLTFLEKCPIGFLNTLARNA